MLDARVQIRRTRLLMSIETGAAEILKSHPFLSGIANELAKEFVGKLANNLSVSTLSIPKDCTHLAHKRKRQLLREFNGRNHMEMARKYGYRVSTVYDLVKYAKDLPTEMPRTELMQEVVSYIVHLVGRQSCMALDAAEHVGHEIADFIAEQFGGLLLSLPGNYNYGNAVRDVLLLEALEDCRLDEQAGELGLSVEAVQRLLSGYRNYNDAGLCHGGS